ncbi:HNH endonuclease [Aquiluna borgnonia]|uniref:HNH endonuclease n=1 Tax=Aquiluna borgnonia TaxID=2499157 RepID=A0A7D4PQ74_9MICO|nr:HNH endonuclease [Aquiluna borgnonia]
MAEGVVAKFKITPGTIVIGAIVLWVGSFFSGSDTAVQPEQTSSKPLATRPAPGTSTPQRTTSPEPTTTPAATTEAAEQVAQASELSALLSALEITPEMNDGYDRDLFRHWVDNDGDGCDTRKEVLIAESLEQVSIGDRCKVLSGNWYSSYDGRVFTDPSDLDIDHFIPLKEAWGSGAYAWDADRRRAFANDLGIDEALIAVSAGSNRSKSDRDPNEWLPTNTDYTCDYIENWMVVKIRWELTVDQAEFNQLSGLATRCAN